MKKTLIAFMLVAVIAISGCADSKSGDRDTYSSKEVNKVSKVIRGQIIEVNAVEIKGDKVVGTTTGVIIGAVAEAFIGGTTTVNVIMGTTGAVAGGYAGYKISGIMNDGEGYEYIIKLDDGDVIRIVQEKTNKLYFGDRVVIKINDEYTSIERELSNSDM